MSEMVERVKTAIKQVPRLFVRHLWDDDCWQVCRYGAVSPEAEIVVLSAWSSEDTARHAMTKAIDDLRARAAIEAMREMTEAMRLEGESAATFGIGHPVDDEAVPRVWQWMINAALKD